MPIAPRKSRWPLRASLCVLFAIVITWLVAWACAAVRPANNEPNVFGEPLDRWSESPITTRFSQSTANGEMNAGLCGTSVSTRAYIVPNALSDLNFAPRNLSYRDFNAPPLSAAHLIPSWAILPAKDTDEVCATTVIWGWPARCLGGTTFIAMTTAPIGSPSTPGTPSRPVAAAAKATSPASPFINYWEPPSAWTNNRIRLLPVRIIWPGILLNTAFYSIILFSALTGISQAFHALRRARRHRRGLCPHCAANLIATPPGSPCPACSAPAPAKHVAKRRASAQRKMHWPQLAIASMLLAAPTTLLATWSMALIRPASAPANILGTPREAWPPLLVFPKFSELTPSGEVLVEITGTPVSTMVTLLPGGSKVSPELRWEFPRLGPHKLAGLPDWPPTSNWTVPPWASLLPSPPDNLAVLTTAWGWPLRCLAGADHQSRISTKGGLRNRATLTSINVAYEDFWQPPIGSTSFDPVLLPLRPIWSGLLINFSLYTILLLLVLSFTAFTYRALRARLRRRRGVCPHCAYNLSATPAGAPCPECGALTPTRAPAKFPTFRVACITLALLLGAATNVLIAWAGYCTQQNPGVEARAARSLPPASPGERARALMARIDLQRFRTRLECRIVAGFAADYQSPTSQELLPAWVSSDVSAHMRSASPRGEDSFFYELAGWPMRSLASSRMRNPDYDWTPATNRHLSTGELTLPPQWAARLGAQTLPFRIIWSGFLLNTLLYAACWMLLALCPLIVIRSIRRLRGRRRHRADNLTATPATSPCPECGTAAKPREVT